MSLRELRPGRDAVNDLYDHGCDLVGAAAELRVGAEAPGSARAVPAVTGCLEAALRELALAAAGLDRASRGAGDPSPSSRRRGARRHRGFVNLEVALHDAADAAAAARALAARTHAPDG